MSTTKTINETYAKLQQEHADYLEDYGVKLPPLHKASGGYNLRGLQLVYLRMHLGKLVHRNELGDFIRELVPDAAGDQQARHLKYDGWDVRLAGKAHDKWHDGKAVPNGYNGLFQVTVPNPEFVKTRVKRAGRTSAKDWDSLVLAYGKRCAMCGAKGVLLEKGHKDPTKGDHIKNLIPLCGKCNNWVNNDVILDDDGHVAGLATSRYVLASPEDVQEKIYRELKKKFK